jgi:hypothetical protein
VLTRTAWEALIVGLAFSAAGLLLRLGRWRYGWPERYVDKDLPAPIRNAAFALLPLGLGIVMTIPSLSCDAGQCSSAADVFAFGGVGLLLVGVATLFVPLAILKPGWLVTIERSGGVATDGATAPPRLSRTVGLAIVAIVGLLLLLAFATGFLTWSPGTLLLVIGLAILGAVSRQSRKKGP